MAEVFTKYTIDTTQAEASLNGMKQEVRELQGAEQSSQKTFQTNAQKRAVALKNEEQLLESLKRRRDKAYNPSEVERLNKAIKLSEQSVRNLRGKYGNLEKGNRSLVSSFKQIGVAIGVAFGVREIINFAKEAAELAAEAEGVRTAFERVGGTTAVMQDLQRATRGTVDQLKLMNRTVQASNFNIPIEQMSDLFEFATNRAIELGEPIDKFVNRIIDGIGRKSIRVLDDLGFSLAELQEEMKTTEDFAQAAANIISREMEEMGDVADTNAVKIQRSQADMKNAMLELGDAVAPVLADVQQGLAGLVRFLVDNKEAFGALALAVGAYTAATRLAKISTVGFAKAFRLSPWGLAASAISLATLAIINWRKNVADANSTARLLSDTQEELNQKFAEERAQLDVLVNRIRESKDGTVARKEAVEELNKNYGDLIGHTIDETTALEQLDAAYQDIIRSMRERIAQQVLQDRQTEILTAQINTQLGAIEDLRGALPNVVDDWGFAINNLGDIMESVRMQSFGEDVSEFTDEVNEAAAGILEFGNGLVKVNGQTAPLLTQLSQLNTAYGQGNKELFLLNQLIDQYVEGQDKANKTTEDGAGIGRTIADIQADIKDAQEKVNTQVAVGTAEYYKARAALDVLNAELERWEGNNETLLDQLDKINGIKPNDGAEEWSAFMDSLNQFQEPLAGLEEFTAYLGTLDNDVEKVEAISQALDGLGDGVGSEAMRATLTEMLGGITEGLVGEFGRTEEEIAAQHQEIALKLAEQLLDLSLITEEQYDLIVENIKAKQQEVIDGQKEIQQEQAAEQAQQFATLAGQASQFVGVIRNVYEATTKDAEKNAGFLKALTIFEILLAQASAIASAVSAAAKGSITAVDLVIKIAAAVGTVIASTASALSQAKGANQPTRPSFGYGGEIQGRPHTQGGVPIEAERGEYVIKSSAYAKAKEAVQAINAERFDSYVTKHYIEPLLKSKQLAREDQDKGFARNIAESLHLDGKAEHYLKQIARKGNNARIENFDELARLMRKDNRGSTY